MHDASSTLTGSAGGLPEWLGPWGYRLLSVGLAAGLALVLGLAWMAPEILPFLPLVLLGLVGLVYLIRHPLLNLTFVIAAFVLISNYEEGLQVTEVFYGLYSLGFLAIWFITRLFFYRDLILDTVEARAVFFFLVLVTLSIPLTFLFGGQPRHMFSEWVSMLLLGFYFPIREAFKRYEQAPKVFLGLLIWIGLFAALRNLYEYQIAISTADYAWQITDNRVIANDNVMMIASLTALILLLFAQTWRLRIFFFCLFFVAFAGLILTLSRGFWVAFAFGTFVLFVIMERRQKIRLAGLVLAGLGGLIGVAFLLFPNYFILIAGGMLDRLASLQTAVTQDISLINRFYETQAVWERIKVNPILGYGMGVDYHYYDITREATAYSSFNHNGFVSLWYRFGILGLLLVLVFWGLAIWHGIQAFRQRSAPILARLCGLAVATALIAYTLPANTSNPFFLNDGTFSFGLMTGVAGGAYHYVKRHLSTRAASS